MCIIGFLQLWDFFLTQVNVIDVFNYIQEENGKKFGKLFKKEAVL